MAVFLAQPEEILRVAALAEQVVQGVLQVRLLAQHVIAGNRQ